jgi:hypothetical protein
MAKFETREDFEADWDATAPYGVLPRYQRGYVSIRCLCRVDHELCQGWVMESVANIREDIKHGIRTQEQLDEALEARAKYLEGVSDAQSN